MSELVPAKVMAVKENKTESWFIVRHSDDPTLKLKADFARFEMRFVFARGMEAGEKFEPTFNYKELEQLGKQGVIAYSPNFGMRFAAEIAVENVEGIDAKSLISKADESGTMKYYCVDWN